MRILEVSTGTLQSSGKVVWSLTACLSAVGSGVPWNVWNPGQILFPELQKEKDEYGL